MWILKNILILNLSRLLNNKPDDEAEPYTFQSDQGEIRGINTNDAPAKYIIKKLHNEGKRLDLIICIKTTEAETAYTEYVKMIKAYCSKYNYSVPVTEPVSGNYEGTNMASVVKSVLAFIDADDHIYLDTTGGARNSSYLLMFITRFIEYEGIKLEQAVYSLLDKVNASNNRITDTTDIYSMFDLINAANTFTSFGNADELSDIFRDSENENIRRTIDALRNFADGVMLCRTDLSDTLHELNESLNAVSKDMESDDPREILFCRIVDVIKRKFRITDSNPVIDYPDIIHWCIDNNLIQQAVTIYCEKMPEYLYRKKYFIPSETTETYYRKQKSSFPFEYQLLYFGLMSTLPDSFIIKVIRKIKDDKYLRKVFYVSESLEEACKDETFNEYISGLMTDELKDDIQLLFSARRLLFDNDGKRRTDEDINELMTEPTLGPLGFIAEMSASNPVKMLNEISDKAEIQMKLFSKSASQEYVLSEFEKMIKDNSEFSLADDVSVSELKTILTDCLYIKKWIRNVVNHAAEEGNNSSLKELFDSAGYNTSDKFCVSDVKEVLNNALSKLYK